LQEGRENANIDAGLGFIWRISANDDPAYLQSLAGQDWFRTKFTVLHQTIINRGSEPEETLHFFQ
jgi:hypothetical protein